MSLVWWTEGHEWTEGLKMLKKAKSTILLGRIQMMILMVTGRTVSGLNRWNPPACHARDVGSKLLAPGEVKLETPKRNSFGFFWYGCWDDWC
jgi:hypothetical protein